jgi:hypothetical protein
MENLERRESGQELSSWVRACSDLLAPPADWEPNLNTALARFEARADARLRRRFSLRRYFLVGAIATLIVCIAVPAIPRTSVLAQQIGNSTWQRLEQLWYWITIVRNPPKLLGRLPAAVKALHTRQLAKPDSPWPVSNAAEAALRAGFLPRLPDSSVLSGSPRLSVLGPMSFAAVVSTADLAEALRTAGVLDRQVPQQWDGAQLTLQIGATVTASWSDVSDERSGGMAWSDLTLAQGPARVVMAPAGFDLEAFAATGLRAAGMRNPDMVLRLAQHRTTAPALLFGYLTPYHFVGAREVNLRTGRATLIEEFGRTSQGDGLGSGDSVPTVERITLLWSAPDRVYVLSGITKTPTTMLSFDLAAALASAIDLANSID